MLLLLDIKQLGVVIFITVVFSMQSNASLKIGGKPSKQILVRKMRHIGQVDKEIRRNWKNLFKFINQDHTHNPEQSPSPHRRVLTECTETHIERKDSNPKKFNAFQSELKRKRVLEQQRKNEEIFFKKRTSDVQTLLKESRQERNSEERLGCSGLSMGLSKRHSLQISRKSVEAVPFMLRRRTAKLQKEMGIIKHNYNDSLQKIENREQLKYSLNLQDRQGLINRIKGSKVYYQFLKEWRSDQQESI